MHFGVVLLQPVRGGGPSNAGAVVGPGRAPVDAGQGAGGAALAAPLATSSGVGSL